MPDTTKPNHATALAHAKSFHAHDLAVCLRSTDYFKRGEIVQVIRQSSGTYLKVNTSTGFPCTVTADAFMRLRAGLYLPLIEVS